MPTSLTAYDIGDVALIGVRFTVSGTLTDPTPDPTCSILPPGGPEVAGTVAHGTQAEWGLLYPTETWPGAATGFWTCRYDVSASGTHRYRWEGLGAAKAAVEGSFIGRHSAF